ncbi:MAG: hypothetical protein HYV97_19990 [Bdellovibrio sp.]|nr:hypothetical protein [Bdellovibrio sp.]
MEPVTNFKHKQNADSINQALQLLYQEDLITAADIHSMAEKDRRITPPSARVMERFNDVVGNLQKASVESFNRAKQKVATATNKTAKRVDESVHDSPWIFIGVASALSGLTGYFLAQRFKR